MYLQFYTNEKGEKVYTTKKESPLGVPTQSAHPGIPTSFPWFCLGCWILLHVHYLPSLEFVHSMPASCAVKEGYTCVIVMSGCSTSLLVSDF
uniref:Nucleolar protein 10 n=1 Tax=Triticum urartu TaxID=4572 RepID=A0A8R7USD6_TRIUA